MSLTPYHRDDLVTLYHGDCIEVMRALPDSSVDAVVTDPPYGLEFMGKEWDSFRVDDPGTMRHRGDRAGDHGETDADRGAFGNIAYGGGKRATTNRCVSWGKRDQFRNEHACGPDAQWRKEIIDPHAAPPTSLAFQEWARTWALEALRVLKPGGHLLAFGGTRTWHRLACAIEDAGFEVRDSIAWMYGSGFPKSLDVSKAIDKAAGATREVVGTAVYGDGHTQNSAESIGYGGSDPAADTRTITAPATPEAARWQGWGTAMKPAHEPVVHGVKPFDNAALLARIGSQLDALEDLCRRHVSDAAESSAPTRHGSPAARTATAPESAATPREAEPGATIPTGAAGASSAATDTSASESTAARFLSTVTSWRACWVELSEHASTSTTSTATSRTTDLQTLSSCLSQIMQSGTATSTPAPESWRSLVTVADNLFAAGVLNSRSTRALSALVDATSSTPPTSLDEDAAPGSRYEPIVVARKPLIGTVAANVLAHGTGALNVDGCRVGYDKIQTAAGSTPGAWIGPVTANEYEQGTGREYREGGRWPANVILDESQARALDAMSGVLKAGEHPASAGITSQPGEASGTMNGGWSGMDRPTRTVLDTGGASRFFYTAKADSSERPRVRREGGSDNATTYGQMKVRECNVCGSRAKAAGGERDGKTWPTCGHEDWSWVEQQSTKEEWIAHPTVKPLDLMRYLVRLVTPPGGVVLEPFAGSGTTLEACIVEGFSCIGIEREADYIPLIMQRITKPIEVTLL